MTITADKLKNKRLEIKKQIEQAKEMEKVLNEKNIELQHQNAKINDLIQEQERILAEISNVAIFEPKPPIKKILTPDNKIIS